ncbi:MAG TPA: hypothetical protein VFN10_12105 [Thermoanaerobaculia bacterium]|nr:hypothetical protein [Thermoanaerobaculia bacterium]
MKTLRILAVLLTLAGLTATAHAQVKVSETDNTKLYITLNTVGTAQALTQKNVYDAKGAKAGELSPGFQTAFGDLGFLGKFGKNEEVEMYFDLYMASRNHPSTTYGNQGYLLLHGIPENLGSPTLLKKVFEKIDIKAGAYLIDFGDQGFHRSNNAIAQNNPLVGNFVIDPNFVSVGAQVQSKPTGKLQWLVGLSNGTNTEDFQAGRGVALNAKVAYYPVDAIRLSTSFYRVNHDGTPAGTGSRATLFSGNRSGERYGAVLGGGQAPGGVLPNISKDVKAGQFDFTFDQKGNPVKLYGHYGLAVDSDLNGNAAGAPQEKWAYYSADAVYQFTSNLYAAARYSAADAKKINDVASDGRVSRIQVGGGLWLTRNILAKVEYVQQKYNGFASTDILNNGIQAWRDPEFSGVVSEVSFSF